MEDVSPELAEVRNLFKCVHIGIYTSHNALHMGREYYGLPQAKAFLFWCDEKKKLDRGKINRIVGDVNRFNAEYAKNEAAAIEIEKRL